ncbi:orphan protein [Pandoravirus kuranda]|uniref:Orphan protein n=1 Tax=Pandoravirus kuranda TaxID=3019033 RepID=A0AA95EE35_9VIRU|nr:orphan protein [Pandoravirus kuranda]
MDATYSLSQQVTAASEREGWQDVTSESTPREPEPEHETLDAVQSAELLRNIEELNNAAARGAKVQFPRRRGWLTFISDVGETHVPFATYDL